VERRGAAESVGWRPLTDAAVAALGDRHLQVSLDERLSACRHDEVIGRGEIVARSEAGATHRDFGGLREPADERAWRGLACFGYECLVVAGESDTS
jgi:hypothetical protein